MVLGSGQFVDLLFEVISEEIVVHQQVRDFGPDGEEV